MKIQIMKSEEKRRRERRERETFLDFLQNSFSHQKLVKAEMSREREKVSMNKLRWSSINAG